MFGEPSPSRDRQVVLLVVIVILVVMGLILGVVYVSFFLYRAQFDTTDFTGVRVYTDSFTEWSVNTTLRNETNFVIGVGGCGTRGNWACPFECPSRHSLYADLVSESHNAVITLQIWVLGEVRNSTTGTYHLSASTVC